MANPLLRKSKLSDTGLCPCKRITDKLLDAFCIASRMVRPERQFEIFFFHFFVAAPYLKCHIRACLFEARNGLAVVIGWFIHILTRAHFTSGSLENTETSYLLSTHTVLLLSRNRDTTRSSASIIRYPTTHPANHSLNEPPVTFTHEQNALHTHAACPHTNKYMMRALHTYIVTRTFWHARAHTPPTHMHAPY